jgi:hypothetical protein
MARSASSPCLLEQVVSLTSPLGVVLAGFYEVLVDGQDRFWQRCRFVAGYGRTGMQGMSPGALKGVQAQRIRAFLLSAAAGADSGCREQRRVQ